MNTKTLLAAGVLAVALPLGAVADSVEIGILTCKTVEGSRTNLLVRSTADVTCVFEDGSGRSESYRGETGIALGLDLSFKSKETIGFSVVSTSTTAAGSHALAGKYVGGKATASVGVGVGAAALVGGSDDNFGLNPLALSGEKGGGASAGIGFLYIEADK